jgi:hypothetical protein
MSVTKNSCNGCLRRPLQEVHIGTSVVEANPGVGLPHLSVTGAK